MRQRHGGLSVMNVFQFPFCFSIIRNIRLTPLYLPFQFLLTPPDEGPRVKGQRIKLQDIIEGMYNPLNSNNGCWISCECFAIYKVDNDNLIEFCRHS